MSKTQILLAISLILFLQFILVNWDILGFYSKERQILNYLKADNELIDLHKKFFNGEKVNFQVASKSVIPSIYDLEDKGLSKDNIEFFFFG